MTGQLSNLIFPFNCVLKFSTGVPSSASTANSICTVDDDMTNPQLDHCLQLGESFADSYEKALKRGKPFDECR
jgi:hypothetical protein